MRAAAVFALALLAACGSGTIESVSTPDAADDATAEAAACPDAGLACAPDDPCKTGIWSCPKGSVFPVCASIGVAPIGTSCGGTKTCNAGGACVDCVDGASCVPPTNACRSGTLDCSGTSAVCRDSGISLPEGTPCGTGSVCSADGTCSGCEQGDACTPTICHAGTIDCSTGAPVCTDTGSLPAGISCGPSSACDGSGGCVCAPQCTGKACGDDGCGGACGACPTGTSCEGSTCVAPCSTSTCAAPKACDADTCSCTAPLPFPIAGCTNVAAGNTYLASRSQASAPPAAAADGDRCTDWNAGGAPSQYWQVTFGTAKTIRGVTLVPQMSPNGVVEIEIETSPTCLTFTSRVLRSMTLVNGQAYSFDFGTNVSARCVRVYSLTGVSWVAYDEVGVFSCP